MFLTLLISFGLKDCVGIPFQYSPVAPVMFQEPHLCFLPGGCWS